MPTAIAPTVTAPSAQSAMPAAAMVNSRSPFRSSSEVFSPVTSRIWGCTVPRKRAMPSFA